MDSDIGRRVLERIEQRRPAPLQRDVAAAAGMTPDAFSRAARGERRFTTLELARIADVTETDLHWLITGHPDPSRLIVAARHAWDPATGKRSVPGRDADRQVLSNIALAYRQADLEPTDNMTLPEDAERTRDALGQEFVADFIDRLETRLHIDVIRIAELSTSYALTIAGRRVIAIPANGNWFRSNFSLAHELGHHVFGTFLEEWLPPEQISEAEAEVNGFASTLLLPSRTVLEVDWSEVSNAQLAEYVWAWGVSTKALANRVMSIGPHPPAHVIRWGEQPTLRLLRKFLPSNPTDPFGDEIADRMDRAANRRFPRILQNSHLQRIADGLIPKDTLAWMLDVDPESLEVDEPEPPAVDADELAAALGI